MLNKVKAVFSLPEVLEKGKMVTNPEAWKTGQINTSVLMGLFAALITAARFFGYDLNLTDEELLSISTAIMAIYGLFYNPVATVVSSDKIGKKPKNSG